METKNSLLHVPYKMEDLVMKDFNSANIWEFWKY